MVRKGSHKPADAKRTDLVEKRGVASNRQGIRYGARKAGAANEHREKRKSGGVAKNYGGRKPAHQTHEQRITKG